MPRTRNTWSIQHALIERRTIVRANVFDCKERSFDVANQDFNALDLGTQRGTGNDLRRSSYAMFSHAMPLRFRDARTLVAGRTRADRGKATMARWPKRRK